MGRRSHKIQDWEEEWLIESQSSGRYQGGIGVASRTETFKGARSGRGTSSYVNTARKDGANSIVGSKIGGNTARENRKKG